MKSKPYTPERRAAVRHQVCVPVETEMGSGVTRDLSPTGLFLLTTAPLAPGDQLHLRIALPDREYARPHWLAGSGSVVRVEKAGNEVGVAIALEDEGLQLLLTAPGNGRTVA